jgi:hypothetical protein
MAFESLIALVSPVAVKAKPDVGRVNPEGQARRDGKGKQQRQGRDDRAHPVPNAQGEITGKLVDVTA